MHLILDTFGRESFVRYLQCFNCDFISARLEAGAFDLIHPGVLEMPTLPRTCREWHVCCSPESGHVQRN